MMPSSLREGVFFCLRRIPALLDLTGGDRTELSNWDERDETDDLRENCAKGRCSDLLLTGASLPDSDGQPQFSTIPAENFNIGGNICITVVGVGPRLLDTAITAPTTEVLV